MSKKIFYPQHTCVRALIPEIKVLINI